MNIFGENDILTVHQLTCIIIIRKGNTSPHKIKEVYTMSIDMMNGKIKELRELRRMADELAGEIEAIQDEIKAHMTEQNTDTLTGVDWKVTWKAVTSKRLDTTALKKALPDVAERFMKESVSKRFTLA